MRLNLFKREIKDILKGLSISSICFIFYVSIFYVWHGNFPYLQEGLYSSFVLLFIGFFVITFTIGKLFQQLLITTFWRFVSVFTYYFLLSTGVWITTYRTFSAEFSLGSMVFSSMVVSLITAFFISKFYGNKEKPVGYFEQLKDYFEEKTLLSWIGRAILAVFLLFSTYYLMNELIFPFIEPYYNSQPALFLEGANQSQHFINKNWMWIQSLLILIIFFPLFALWRGSKSSLLFWVGFPLFLICALGPFIVNFQWPLGFRFTLLVEMTAIMYIQSFIIVHLFFVPKEQEEMNEKYSASEWKINRGLL